MASPQIVADDRASANSDTTTDNAASQVHVDSPEVPDVDQVNSDCVDVNANMDDTNTTDKHQDGLSGTILEFDLQNKPGEEEKPLLNSVTGSNPDVTKRTSSDVKDHRPSSSDESENSGVDSSSQNKPDTRCSIMVEDTALVKKDRCANIHLFLVNYCFLLMFYMSQNIYNIGVVRTIERKYGLRSSQSGLIMSMNDISHIMVVIFVGYFGKKAHKPRFLSVSLLLCALAALLMATPYFIFGADNVVSPPTPASVVVAQPQALHGLVGNMTAAPYRGHPDTLHTEDTGICDPHRPDYECTDEQVEEDSGNMAAYYIMLVAQFISGAGGSGVTTLGFSYIDENAPSHKAALYLGLVSSMFSFAPVAALGLAALCLQLPENPTMSTTLEPDDPQWIGCWWLGYVICAVGIILSCIPMWFFPKYIIQPVRTEEQEKHHALSIREQLKEFPRSTMSLLKNGAFMTLVVMSISLMYVVTGLYSNLPRYMEVHFLKPAFIASFVAISGAAAGVIGGIVGGLIMNKWKIKPKGATKIIIFSSAVMCVGVAINMCLGCPQLQMAGEYQEDGQFSVEMPCNTDCQCETSRQAYSPVCGQDGLTYFSPCHAGCTTHLNGNYSECSCTGAQNTSTPLDSQLPGISLTDIVTPGTCGIVCNMLVFYVIVSCIFSLVGSVCRAPSAIVLFRIVGDEQRSFALGISSFLTNLLAFIPAPLMFGAIIDSTCILWSTTCSGTGSCLLYDTRLFRLAIHGSALCFKVLSFICTIVIYVLIKDKVFPEKAILSEKDVKAVVISDEEAATMLEEKPEKPEKLPAV